MYRGVLPRGPCDAPAGRPPGIALERGKRESRSGEERARALRGRASSAQEEEKLGVPLCGACVASVPAQPHP